MRLNFALIPSLLLASAVVARLGHHSTHRKTRPLSGVGNSTHDRPISTDTNWAGAILDGNFFTVAGTFIVPIPSGPNSSASAWVGIDGKQCENAILQTGVNFIVDMNNDISYTAWYEYYPDSSYYYDNFGISPGDEIRLKVDLMSPNIGVTTIENLSTGQSTLQLLHSDQTLCCKNAEWIVEDYGVGGEFVPFANFSSVTFTDTFAAGPSGNYSLKEASISDIVQYGQRLTYTTISGSSVHIQYV